jgi:hypothetical protein
LDPGRLHHNRPDHRRVAAVVVGKRASRLEHVRNDCFGRIGPLSSTPTATKTECSVVVVFVRSGIADENRQRVGLEPASVIAITCPTARTTPGGVAMRNWVAITSEACHSLAHAEPHHTARIRRPVGEEEGERTLTLRKARMLQL